MFIANLALTDTILPLVTSITAPFTAPLNRRKNEMDFLFTLQNREGGRFWVIKLLKREFIFDYRKQSLLAALDHNQRSFMCRQSWSQFQRNCWFSCNLPYNTFMSWNWPILLFWLGLLNLSYYLPCHLPFYPLVNINE